MCKKSLGMEENFSSEKKTCSISLVMWEMQTKTTGQREHGAGAVFTTGYINKQPDVCRK